MSHELKIKTKSLCAESVMIRQEETKLKRQARWSHEHQDSEKADAIMRTHHSLYKHRTQDVRCESRATNLARAFIKSMPYNHIERNSKSGAYEMGWLTGRTEKLVKKYGTGTVVKGDIALWMQS